MSADEVLDAIDRAVRDFETGPNAMRWSPESTEAIVTPRSPGPGARMTYAATGHAYILDETHEWTEIGTVTSDGLVPSSDAEALPYDYGGFIPRSPTVTLAVDTRQAVAAFARLAENVKQSMGAFGAAFSQAWGATRRAVHILHAQRYPRDHVRCRECYPCANPRPLKVNGADYQRRRRNRRLR